MKLSDMFANLSRSAQDLEGRVSKWESELNAKSDELLENAKAWLASAQKRDDELKAKAVNYLNSANEQVKAQWAQTQAGWEAEFARVKAKASEARSKAEAMQAQDAADWYEAYATHMVSFAQRVQEEASNAVAGAAKARADAVAAKTAG
jgi:hypothetical protein